MRSRQAAFKAIAVFAALAAIEIVCRLGASSLAPAAGLKAVDALLGRNQILQRIRPHPYLLYENTPHFREFGIEQHNSLGYRGPEIRLARQAGVARILALGGSTTYGWLLHDPADAWPAQLERLLRARGLAVEVINGGLNSATSAELLAKWIFRDRYLGADIVIVCGPGNDVWPLMFPNYNPEYTHYRKTWDQVALAPRAGEQVLLQSAAARVAYALWLDWSQAPLGIFRDPTVAPRIDPADALRAVQHTEPVGYERNMGQLVRAIVADGAQPVLFKMFRGPRRVFDVLPKEARAIEPFYEAVEVAQAKESAIGERLAAAVGAPWIALADDAVPLADFIDHTHLTADGERIKAERLVDTITELLKRRGVGRGR